MNKEKHEYLCKEYELCFEQLRFYDSRSLSLLKYLFTLTSAVATAQFAVFKLSRSLDESFYACQAFLSLVVFVAVALILMSMVQNRLYFVLTARQINAIRKYFVRIDPDDGFQNQLYTSTTFAAHKASSVHTFQLVGAALLCGLYAGSFTFAMLQDITLSVTSLAWVLVVTTLVTCIACYGAFAYLKKQGNLPSDASVHGAELEEHAQHSPAGPSRKAVPEL